MLRSRERDWFKKTSGGVTYYIQLKLGPNTMNIGMVTSLNEMISKVKEDFDVTGILGMAYGKTEGIPAQIWTTLNDFEHRAKIGKDYWKLITGDPNYYDNPIQEFEDVKAYGVPGFNAATLQDIISDKKCKLIDEWRGEYGDIGEVGLQEYMRRYLELEN